MNSNYRKPLHGTNLHYFDARAAVDEIQPGAWDKLPYTARVLAENLVRRCEPHALVPSLKQLIERKRDLDFPWFPARVVCHDILGQTALVDLAGLRDAIALQGGDPRLVNPVVPTQLVVDHSLAVECGGFDPDAFAKNRAIEDRRNEDRFDFIEWTRKAFQNVDVIPPGNGILHQINLERMSPVVQVRDGVAFPDTLVGTDSHTPMVDALGVIAIGVGGLEAESVMLGRASYMRLPDIVGVELTGKVQPGISATDVVLALTEFLRTSKVVSAYLEFYGAGAASLTLGDRATISNMAPEYGATAAMFSIDEQTINYLKLTGRDDELVKLVELYAKETGLWSDTLANVEYERVLQFDLSTVVRNIAGPSNPHKRVPTSELAARGIAGVVENEPGRMPDGAVIIAAITSCTNTNNPRNMVAAGLLARNANKAGLLRKPWVKSSLAPGSKAVALYLEEAGLLPELEQLGFGIVAFACTTCNGMSGALDPVIQQEIIARDLYATAVLSGNRNFDGRIHPYAKQAFLASPALVVAYAIAGTIRFDIEKDVLGVDPDGTPVTLASIWPSDEEIDAVVAQSVKPQQFRNVYDVMFARQESTEEAVSPLYDWRPTSTYIRRPPYWEGALAGVRTLQGMRPLAVLGDNITTDHLSPSNAIMMDSAAGEYLHKMGLPEEDFNSYATHRGDHLTAQRATFANPTLKNEMVRDDFGNGRAGAVRAGSLARIEPEGTVTRMWEAIETYMARKQPLIVIAGADYGQGSSRDWAAKGVRLAGVEAIVAEGFERIHRTNLVGMGVLPLEFQPGVTRLTLGIDGTETFDVVGQRTPRAILSLVIHRKNGETVEVPVTCRLDTAEEVSIYEAGGVLQRFAQDFLASTKVAA
ncbi:Fe/S-dependent 2-methylisocitrate dehydratase AcnD [Herbaspirillum sp. SJZ107]|uniref:Fe/S-dependent 2-methylisocitrate dehydratase AcnD n=1 Tax=Herbaspirillum sp. SJZ107 TaxID=2572881 RepID=UPI0011515330|nr:Fe/S-dependent 2-methylisocitrate dehydratase AcnD [Herbaspirillum sp. SJZ107]TQK10593.1 aconitase /2-methylcitrate dehydratase (trans-methylaconitate-forming) [Herbaspirillum sp. SJZ107]